MEYKTLRSEWHLDHPENFRIRFISGKNEKKVLHNHEYYEIFLTLSPDITHIINGKELILPKGTLVFIRPKDIHSYMHKKNAFSFINAAFSTDILDGLLNFMNNPTLKKRLLESNLSPQITLNDEQYTEAKKLFRNMHLICSDNHQERQEYFKMVLTVLFTKFFSKIDAGDKIESSASVPHWLLDCTEKMKDYDNFTKGIEAMIAISGVSYEHLARCMKKYYNQTASQFVNNLRINYAANLLRDTNMSIIDICYASGFNNMTHFNSNFKKFYSTTPSAYRKY